jgi:hypothetical protein
VCTLGPFRDEADSKYSDWEILVKGGMWISLPDFLPSPMPSFFEKLGVVVLVLTRGKELYHLFL